MNKKPATLKLFATAALVAMVGFATHAPAAIAVDGTASGSGILAFDSLPAASEWATAELTGTDATATTPETLDTFINTLSSSTFAATLGTVTANPVVTTTKNGRWNSTDLRLTSRAGLTAATCFMATLQNTSGAAIDELDIRFTLSGAQPPTEDPGLAGYALYYSLTGAAGTWQRIGVHGTPGAVMIDRVALNSAWEDTANLHVLWVDDNAKVLADGWWGFDDVSFAKSPPEAAMLTFGLPGLPADITGTDIAWTVPYGTNLATLAPVFTMSRNATCDQPNGAPPSPDFSAGPVAYRVTAEGGVITQTYTVTVNVTPVSAACDMLAFGPGAAINGTVIAWTVPYGTDPAALAPTFIMSSYATCNQPNGSIPAPDFSTCPVHYLVTAQDGVTTTDYTVTIAVGPRVAFSLTPLGKTASSTGSEILNTGTLVKAYHFGNGPVDTTVGGVVFTAGNSGTGAPFAATGLSGSSNGMKGWLSGQLGYSFTNAAYAELIDQAYVGGAPVMSIGGLTVGNEYRLQIILQDTRGTPSIEGVSGPSLTPGNPGMITVTWLARDETLNGSWSGGASPHVSGYALHDMGVPVAAYDTWANSFGAGFTDKDPTHDPDGDGLSSFREFAFGLDPTTGASANPITVPLSGTQFRYAKWADSGLTYKVYYSTDLSDWIWDEFAVQAAAAPNDNGVSEVTVTLSSSSAPVNGKLFVRVQASQ